MNTWEAARWLRSHGVQFNVQDSEYIPFLSNLRSAPDVASASFLLHHRINSLRGGAKKMSCSAEQWITEVMATIACLSQPALTTEPRDDEVQAVMESLNQLLASAERLCDCQGAADFGTLCEHAVRYFCLQRAEAAKSQFLQNLLRVPDPRASVLTCEHAEPNFFATRAAELFDSLRDLPLLSQLRVIEMATDNTPGLAERHSSPAEALGGIVRSALEQAVLGPRVRIRHGMYNNPGKLVDMTERAEIKSCAERLAAQTFPWLRLCPICEELPEKRAFVCRDNHSEHFRKMECAHWFCKGCLEQWVHATVSSHSVQIRCPQSECK